MNLYYTRVLLVLSFLVVGYAGAGTEIVTSDHPNTLVIDVTQGRETIAPEIYGHFAEHLGRCIYDGLWVGEDSDIPNIHGLRQDAVYALRELNIPVLRWPGGCFADEYHWRDGIGPRDQRPQGVNTNWGMVPETHAFGTHEFLELCELLHCDAYIAGNVGSGTVEEMQDWVEYMTYEGQSEMAKLRQENGREKPWKVKYFGVGNENWGCGGQMSPEYYADLYLRYQTYVREYSGNELKKVACGPGGFNDHWMEVVTSKAHQFMDAISLHHYVRGTGTWQNKGSALEFDEREWFYLMKNTLDVHRLIQRNKDILDRVDPRKRIGLYVDEWGTWWDPTPETNPAFLAQANTLRDALSAGIFLNAFNQHCDRVRMANIAQAMNVLQAMLLTEGRRMILTPTYHVFEMYKVHQGATLLPIHLSCHAYTMGGESIPCMDVSCSRTEDGEIFVSLCNLHPKEAKELSLVLEGMKIRKVEPRVLTAPKMNSQNTFDDASIVVPRRFERWLEEDGRLRLELPSKSIVTLLLTK